MEKKSVQHSTENISLMLFEMHARYDRFLHARNSFLGFTCGDLLRKLGKIFFFQSTVEPLNLQFSMSAKVTWHTQPSQHPTFQSFTDSDNEQWMGSSRIKFRCWKMKEDDQLRLARCFHDMCCEFRTHRASFVQCEVLNIFHTIS